MNQKVKFYDPHPGLGGAIAPLPQSMFKVAHELDGQSMSLEEAMEKVSAVARSIKGKAEVIEDKEYISFEFNTGRYKHIYRLIRYQKS